MANRKANPCLQKKAFKSLYGLLAMLPLDLSDRYNAVYGLQEMAAALAFMCEKGESANKALTTMKIANPGAKIPTPQWLLGILGSIPHDTMEKSCQRMLADTVKALVKAGFVKRRVMIALDCHMKPLTGEDRGDRVVGGKPKGGTSWFEGYITMAIVGLLHMPHLHAIRMVKGVDTADYVRRMLLKLHEFGLQSGLCLLDREFCTVAVMRMLDRMGAKFLMPMKMTAGAKKALAEYKRGTRKSITRYTMVAADGTTATFWLVIKKRMQTSHGKRTWRHLVFATNVQRCEIKRVMRDVPATYKKRWRIENAYKSVKSIRPMTTSKKHSIRTFLMFISIVQCNLWYTTNHEIEAAAMKSRGRPVKRRMAQAVFMAYVIRFALDLMMMDMDERKYHLQCVK